MMKLLLLCISLAPLIGAVEPKSIDYDVMFDEIIEHADKNWNSVFKKLKQDGKGAEAIKLETAHNDAYMSVLKTVKESSDVKVKDAMIIYQYKHFILLYTDQLKHVDSTVNKMKIKGNLHKFKKQLVEFEQQIKSDEKKE